MPPLDTGRASATAGSRKVGDSALFSGETPAGSSVLASEDEAAGSVDVAMASAGVEDGAENSLPVELAAARDSSLPAVAGTESAEGFANGTRMSPHGLLSPAVIAYAVAQILVCWSAERFSIPPSAFWSV